MKPRKKNRHLNFQLSHSRKAYRQPDYRRKVEIAIAKGLGQLDKSPYRPWITVAFCSSGMVTRHRDPATGFAIHSLSLGESDWIRTLLSYPNHLGLYSQVALPRQDTKRIATELGLDHPYYPDRKTDFVLSTDIVQVLWVDGQRKLFAYSVKSSSKMPGYQKRNLDIEEAYWREQGVPWKLVYRTEAPENRFQYYRWFESHLPTSPIIPLKERWREIEDVLYPLVKSGRPLNAACLESDAKLGLQKGDSLSQVRFYLCAQVWVVDLDIPINPFEPLTILTRDLEAL